MESLHLKNNAWAYFFKVILKEAVGISNILSACKTFSQVPQDCCFAGIVNALKYEVKMGRLARKVSKWFDETQGKKGNLQYRFTGKESRMFCEVYMK